MNMAGKNCIIGAKQIHVREKDRMYREKKCMLSRIKNQEREIWG